MAEITTTQAFSDGDTVTATKLNNITANAAIQTEAITNRSAETTVDQANDLLLMYDASATALKKVSLSNVIKAGTASNFPVTGNATIGGTLGVTGVISAASTLELGHASDTTLSRGAAGRLQVEGVDVPTISSTDTLTNKTLTSPAISGGTINNAVIGGTTAAAGSFTTLSATSPITTQAGTASAPAIQPTGDTNTGIFFPAADTIAFSEGGTESMRIDSSGNVGIGGSPSTLLNIIKDDRANGAVLRLTNSAESSSWVSGDIIGDIDFFSSDSSGSGVRGRIRSVSEGGSTNPNSVAMSFWTYSGGNVSERLRIDSSGNVGIGETNPQRTLHVKSSSASEILRLQSASNTGQAWIGIYRSDGTRKANVGFGSSVNDQFFIANEENGPMSFYTNNTERLRITSGGDACIGTTSAGIGNNLGTTIEASAYDNARITINHSNDGSSNGSFFMQFGYGGARIGSISQASSTAVAFNTSSDYRLKTNLEPISNGIERIKQLPVYRFNWIDDIGGNKVDGFVAHEVTPVVPEAINGEKDAVDADGKPVYQGIDQSKIVPLLTAALKEAIAKIETLESKVAALEAA